MTTVTKVVIPKAGNWNQLTLKEVPQEPCGPGQVRVQVEAIGVNYADVCVRMGVYSSAEKYVGWPITPGFEVAGVVTEVGTNVTDLEVGAEVMAVTRFGGYTSELVTERDLVMARPPGFDKPEHAAGFPTVHLTAWYGLYHQGRVEPGETVLIHSAAGGVGGAMCALAKAAGARVVGVVGRSPKVEVARERGADEVIDKSTENLWGRAGALSPGGYDVVLDANGVETLRQSYAHLAPEGRLIIYGFHTMLPRKSGRPNLPTLAYHWLRTPKFDPIDMTGKNVTVAAFNLSYLFERRERLLKAVETLHQLAADGVVTPPETTTFALRDVADAHRALETGTTVGKLVLRP